MNGSNINWGLYSLDEFFLEEDEELPPLDADLTVEVSVDLTSENASQRKALIRARKKFIEVSNCKPRFQSVKVLREKEIILFTSRLIEYTVEIVVDYASATEYYRNQTDGS